MVVVFLFGLMLAAFCRVLVVVISLRGVPPKHRAEILHGVAAVLRWWPR